MRHMKTLRRVRINRKDLALVIGFALLILVFAASSIMHPPTVKAELDDLILQEILSGRG